MVYHHLLETVGYGSVRIVPSVRELCLQQRPTVLHRVPTPRECLQAAASDELDPQADDEEYGELFSLYHNHDKLHDIKADISFSDVNTGKMTVADFTVASPCAASHLSFWLRLFTNTTRVNSTCGRSASLFMERIDKRKDNYYQHFLLNSELSKPGESNLKDMFRVCSFLFYNITSL